MYRNCGRNTLVEVLRGEKKKIYFLFLKKKQLRILAIFLILCKYLSVLSQLKKTIIRYFTDLSATDSTSTYFTAAGHQQLFLKVIC